MENLLTPKQQEAIPIILSSSTLEKAAEQIGVDVRTIFRWKKQPAFQEALNRAMLERAKELSIKTLAFEDEAIDTLVDIMRHPEQACANTKMRCAQLIADLGKKNREMLYITQRLERIEEWSRELPYKN